MSDIFTLYDIYLQSRVSGVEALQAHSDKRITDTSERLRVLEQRYDRMRMVNIALWGLLKKRLNLTDDDLKSALEIVDTHLGSSDGRLTPKATLVNCPHCSHPIKDGSLVCIWCGYKLRGGDAFNAT